MTVKSIIQVAVGIIINQQQQILVAMRPQHVYLGGLWEFPGGKMEVGEQPLAALQRELHEELAIVVETATPLLQVEHEYPDRHVMLDVWQITQFSGEPCGAEGQQIAWMSLSQIKQLQFPAANYSIVKAIEKILS